MSVRTDFYLLDSSAENHYYGFLCRLIEKIYKHQHRIYIYAEDEQQAYKIDQQLWTYDEGSFIPHLLVTEGLQPAPAIQIGYAPHKVPAGQEDILINLAREVPDFSQRFQRIIEVIVDAVAAKEQGRKRYKNYRATDNTITTHTITL